MTIPASKTSPPALMPTLLDGAQAEGDDRPLLVLGPSLGTSVTALWAPALPYLKEHFTLVGWDLPGHGNSAPADAPFTLDQLAESVISLQQQVSGELGLAESLPRYAAGVSIAGAVSLLLARSADNPFAKLAALCSAAKFGEPEMWQERADLVERAGTPTMVEGSARRWFAPGFLERHPARATRLLHDLQGTDRHSYAYACRALAGYDTVADLPHIAVPVLALAGAQDEVCSPESVEQIAQAIPQGRYEALAETAHQAPTESPEATAEVLKEFFHGR